VVHELVRDRLRPDSTLDGAIGRAAAARSVAFSGVAYLLVLLSGSLAMGLGASIAWGLSLLFGSTISLSEFASVTMLLWIAVCMAGTIGFVVYSVREWRLDRRARIIAELHLASEMLRVHWEEDDSDS